MFNNKVLKTSVMLCGADISAAVFCKVSVTGNKKLAITAMTAASRVLNRYRKITVRIIPP